MVAYFSGFFQQFQALLIIKSLLSITETCSVITVGIELDYGSDHQKLEETHFPMLVP